jgi:7-cyano-7-deazaguanine reductase
MTRTVKKSSYESRQDNVRTMRLPEIESVANKYADRNYTISLDVQEFSCVCPKTGMPDYAVFEIEYVPDRRLVELRALKLYLTAFRNIGIFHENVTNRIADDFIRACRPRCFRIKGVFNVRGGIKTAVEREYRRKRFTTETQRHREKKVIY